MRERSYFTERFFSVIVCEGNNLNLSQIKFLLEETGLPIFSRT